MMKVDSETEEQKEMMMEQENYKKSRQESGNCRVFDRKGSNHHRKVAAMMCNKTTMVMTMVMAMLTRTKRERKTRRME